ncbi:hydroxycarboxylic acid receptor 2 [Amphiprion ocellaris]|uniref:G-protein coupled receptors family 1 profile domain-containing protein n=1 Tax=Amphiprion ocellaris TaxID=80972 RepID=A0AAQ6ANN9_AMPOC|nr:hydroxycarboxylic acid receptor 2 [Amphiprion ocellaris]
MDLVTGTPIVVNETSTRCLSAQEDAGTLFLQMIMIIEITVGLPGNIIALWIFFFRMKFWKPHIIFLLNLVLADFLLLISVPFRIHTHMRGEYWVFGEVWCSINLFMLAVNRSASIAFMTVVALDRYFKVIHPHHWISQMTLTHAAWLAGLTWVAVIALRIPLLTTNLLQQDGNISLCRSFNFYKVIPVGVKIHYVAFVAEFFLPWFLLLFSSAKIACYLNQQKLKDMQKRVRRAIRAVAVISIVFTFCFMPSVITGLVALYIRNLHPMKCKIYHRSTQLFMTCISFTYLNSASDPFIYFYSSSMFRNILRSSNCFKKHVSRVINAEK